MKKMIISMGLSLVFFSACKTTQSGSFSDDIYANPAEERQLARQAAEAKAKKEAEQRAKEEEARLAQKAKDDANPYYQDPKSDPDDYYDYKYASRLNRFSDPIPGAGYYDSRYTNYYTYNQNPAMFGTSIYSSYNWMPSNQFGYYSSGISISFGSGYGYNNYYGSPYSSFSYGYNPYGYSNFGYGYYDPFYSGYNSAFYNGYYAGYNNGYYGGGWGYLNSYDANSGYSYYGPRGSNGGSNSRQGTTAGMAVPEENERSRFMRTMAEQQESTPRFTEQARTMRNGSNGFDDQQMNTPRNAVRNSNATENPSLNNGNTTNSNPRSNGSRRVRETPELNNSNQNSPTNANRNAGGVENTNSNHSSGGSDQGERSGGGSSNPRGSSGGNKPR